MASGYVTRPAGEVEGRDSRAQMHRDEVIEMECAYKAWTHHPVILHLLTDGIRVPLRGRLVGETAKALRIRVEETWDFDIFKSMVLGIEADLPIRATDEVRTQ